MSKNDNMTDGFDLIVIEFLANFGLFSQIRNGFEASSCIVTPAPPRLYVKNIFIILFYTLI